MNYSDLTPTQRIEVVWLFADEYFGSRAFEFDYHIDARGDICGRTALVPVNAKVTRCANTNASVTMSACPQLTQDQGQRANAASDSMARVIASQLYSEAEHATV